MNIYIMRHGETVWNIKGITQGKTNNRLSQLGVKQAEESGEKILGEKIDLIISSPLMRTMQTANLVNKNLHLKIIRDDELIEVDQGIYTGRKYSSLSDEEKARKNLRLVSDGVETYDSIYQRAENFLNKIRTVYNDKNILIVTHNVVASALECLLTNKNFFENNAQNSKLFANAQIKKFNL